MSLKGTDLTQLDTQTMRERRTDIQMIFQDPISSLNPRRTIGEVVAEPLHVWGPKDGDDQWAKVSEMLDAVGIDPDVARYKRPHEFSGGQCQRISIARALVMEPELIICDEPVSALDVSVQAQILNLLEDLKAKYGLTLVFIAHDLAVVKNISDRVAVMYLGKMCELSESDELYAHPAHPYTRLLMDSHPEPNPEAEIDESMVAARRAALADRAAVRLSIPNPLSACRRTMCTRRTADAPRERRPLRRVPPSARRRPRDGGVDQLTVVPDGRDRRTPDSTPA